MSKDIGLTLPVTLLLQTSASILTAHKLRVNHNAL